MASTDAITLPQRRPESRGMMYPSFSHDDTPCHIPFKNEKSIYHAFSLTVTETDCGYVTPNSNGDNSINSSCNHHYSDNLMWTKSDEGDIMIDCQKANAAVQVSHDCGVQSGQAHTFTFFVF